MATRLFSPRDGIIHLDLGNRVLVLRATTLPGGSRDREGSPASVPAREAAPAIPASPPAQPKPGRPKLPIRVMAIVGSRRGDPSGLSIGPFGVELLTRLRSNDFLLGELQAPSDAVLERLHGLGGTRRGSRSDVLNVLVNRYDLSRGIDIEPLSRNMMRHAANAAELRVLLTSPFGFKVR